jgi:hypothetical protein
MTRRKAWANKRSPSRKRFISYADLLAQGVKAYQACLPMNANATGTNTNSGKRDGSTPWNRTSPVWPITEESDNNAHRWRNRLHRASLAHVPVPGISQEEAQACAGTAVDYDTIRRCVVKALQEEGHPPSYWSDEKIIMVEAALADARQAMVICLVDKKTGLSPEALIALACRC